MSVLFPQVRPPRRWDFRPRYYDPEKERRALMREQRRQERKEGEHHTTLHRGSFREAREANRQMKDKARSKSRIAFWTALLLMLIFCFYYLI